MPGFGLLADDFDDGVRDPVLWSGSYGDIAEADGRARVPCTTGYAAYATASAYSLASAQVACRVHPPAAGGATDEALAEVLVLSGTGGTDAGFSLNAVTGTLRLVSRTGYADPAEVALTYSPSDHAWVRLRESAGSLYWETSADGVTWTTRRTAASPAWVSGTALELVLAAHRGSGLDDFAEFDDLNITRPGQCGPGSAAVGHLSPHPRTAPSLEGG
ncbi:hypothetical protein [Streptomyces sp. NPDC002265]|uniref:hypothetical protein n=1 Tax=Streptomyces sp. NPDC002265 TaxID=3154415 RepID=UPI003329738E